MEELKIEKIVNGGQGLATMPSGRKIFLWNALPGEIVVPQIWRKKKNYFEGIAQSIVKPSKNRIKPLEPEVFLGSSPWQIMDFEFENNLKKQIVDEIFKFEKLDFPKNNLVYGAKMFSYRNKMEYSFWADERGLHLALFNRGSHQKQIVQGSALAMPTIDLAAKALVDLLNKNGIRGSDLKSLIIRCNQKGDVVAALFVKTLDFPKITLPKEFLGLAIYYSNPKSPASVITEQIYILGNIELEDTILGQKFCYDVNSFFQVNIPVYEIVLKQMKEFVEPRSKLVDFYSGVGTIGLSLGQVITKSNQSSLILVELDKASAIMAQKNAKDQAKVVVTSSEKALEYIKSGVIVVFDPPRSGLHPKIISHLIEQLPDKILYLSCNPVTLGRDVSMLKDDYKITFLESYNFFPRTPHIETLVVLEKV